MCQLLYVGYFIAMKSMVDFQMNIVWDIPGSGVSIGSIIVLSVAGVADQKHDTKYDSDDAYLFHNA